MAVKHKMSGKGMSIPAGIAIGVIVAVAVMLLGALIMAYFVVKETIDIGGIGVGEMGIIAVASALGAWIATNLTKEKKLLVCGVTGLIFYLILLSITAVFFDGIYRGMGLTALMILLGTAASLLPGLRQKKGRSKIKIPAYR